MRNFFRIVLIIFNILVALSLLLTYLCCFISPEKAWWLSFFGLAYIYLLVANICFVLLWALSRKKKRIIISLVAILIGWIFIWRNVQLSADKLPEEEVGNALKVFTYNIQGFEHWKPKDSDGKKSDVFEYFQSSDADIICMQEFMDSQWVKELSEKNICKRLTKTPYAHIEKPMGNYGIATFSKHPIIRKELIYSDNTTNACMCTDLLIGKDTVRVYNMHLKSVGFSGREKDLLNNAVKKDYSESDVHTLKDIIWQMKSSYIRRQHQVEKMAAHIARSPYPVIICGDFNDPPTSYTYQNIRGNRKDSFIEAGSGRSTTYNIGRISSQRIDYIIHSDNFKAYDYESPRVHYSDHFPVMCKLVMTSDK